MCAAALMTNCSDDADGAVVELTKVDNELSEDVAMTMDTLKREIADLSTKVNVTMIAIGNLSRPSTRMDYGRIKVPSPGHMEGHVMRRSSKTFSSIWNNIFKQ
ncbi:hypothetical protein FNV43_RR02081 [Rhamnella rubrinervis]|uniref:Uncharacterized protein n=1 Tax=Rhamnella rubrinervis TaxID=2594499 RepID=A0A8K0HTB1_9ROSA|nr:hypothetical protein FNV43_RR02081 [Rhamnella rubrinervis]